ncbi:hypothetical protein F5B22DRAFT_606042 [Xylaria bambusicola]|uniref:uncharacterized protein n=1 Tax=Xylaria bambusicola TaxID=326684 RepID=UPI00200776C4|nr:uncharacterized protein F5B22DRAFT_606042 [Xylaria bambusicola]KAI0517056.1 hypothetical protein F5B22DRAFT_606042 [Xylaria bambusicola]
MLGQQHSMLLRKKDQGALNMPKCMAVFVFNLKHSPDDFVLVVGIISGLAYLPRLPTYVCRYRVAMTVCRTCLVLMTDIISATCQINSFITVIRHP